MQIDYHTSYTLLRDVHEISDIAFCEQAADMLEMIVPPHAKDEPDPMLSIVGYVATLYKSEQGEIALEYLQQMVKNSAQ